MKGFLLCVMVVLNLPHGPDDSDLRDNQIRDSMLEHYRMSSCTMSPIFEQLATDILKERDDVKPEECESPEAALWRVLSVDTFYKRKGYRVNISRFFSVVAESIKLLARWHTMLFEVSVPAIELGMLSNMTLPRIKLCTKGGDPDGDPDTTSRNKLATDERSLRSCGANALVIAFSLLSDKNNRRSLACMCLLAQPCMDFHGASSRTLRDVNSSKVWLLEQNRGGIYKHMCETMDLLGDLDFLGATGFLSKASGGIEHMTNDEVQHDCDFAAFAGAFCTSLMKARLRRTLYLSGYPHCFILLLGTSREQTHLIDKLRSDHQNYEDLKAVPRPSALTKAYLERSPFNLLSVQQVILALKESEYRVTPELTKTLDSRFSTIMQSQGVEDMNNFQKNGKQENGWGGRYRKPQTGLAICVRKKILQNIHKFDSVPTDRVGARSVEPLSKADMSVIKDPSLPFSNVATPSQRAPYYSPSAESVGQPTADLEVLASRRRSGAHLDDVQGIAMGFFADSTHCVCFRRRQDIGEQTDWFVGMYHYTDSACLGWPVDLVSVSTDDSWQYLVWRSMSKAVLILMFDLKDLDGFSYEWKAWSWQLQTLGATTGLRPALRAFRQGPIDKLESVVARSAWWALPRSTMENVAESLGIDLTGAASTFDVAFKLTKGVLQCSDDEVFTILEKRMMHMAKTTLNMEEVMQVDEAAQCLREEDREEMQKEQKKMKESNAEEKGFRKVFSEKRAQARPNGAAGVRAAASAYVGPKKLPPLAHLKQSGIKQFVPPGGYLWRARNSNSWNSRYKSFLMRSCRENAWVANATPWCRSYATHGLGGPIAKALPTTRSRSRICGPQLSTRSGQLLGAAPPIRPRQYAA